MSSSETRAPITREAFILPSHIQTALRGPNYPHAPATMTVVREDGQMSDVPVPAEFVQRGVLPPGFAVDFLFDPEELVAKFTQSGLTYMDEVPEEAFQKMAGIINDVGNLKIVPQWLYDHKRTLINSVVAQHSTPETVMQQMRNSGQPQAGSSTGSGEESSQPKKEKKKSFFKGLFGNK